MAIPKPITTYLLLLVLATAVPLLLVNGYFLYNEARNAEYLATARLGEAVNDISRDADAFIQRAVDHLEYLARQPAVRNADPLRCHPLLAEFLRSNASAYSLTAVTDANAKIVCWSLAQGTAGKDYSDREWFRESMNGTGPQIGKPIVGRVIRELVVPLTMPLTDTTGKPRGVLLIGLKVQEISRLVAADRGLPPGSVITVTSREGTIIARSLQSEKWLGQDGHQIPAIAAQLAQKSGVAKLAGADGMERVNVFNTFARTGWLVSAGIPTETLALEYRSRLSLSIIATVSVIVLVLAFAVFWAQRIRKPILSLAAAARDAARGNLDARADETGPEEIVTVAQEFNRMNATRGAAEANARALENAHYARGLIEASLDPMVTISKEGRITDVNHATEQATGIPRTALIGSDFADYFTEPEQARKGYRRVLAEGFVRDYPLAMRHTSGGVIEVVYNATTYANEAGELRGVFATAHDITDRNQLNKIVEKKEQYLRKLIESSSDAFFVMNRTGTLIYRSPSGKRLTGWDDSDVLGTNILTYVMPESVATAQNAIADAIRHPSKTIQAELRLRRKDGSQIDIEALGRNLLDDPDVAGIVITARDITERNRLEAVGHARLDRVRQQMEAVGRIAMSDALLSGDVECLAREITEEAARITGVERANVWLFNDDETELRCIDLYEATPGTHAAGAVLREEHFRNEFRALKSASYVNADDPMTDQRTAGYVETYLKPLRITSMLDAIVQISGKHLGLLCLEHVDRPHHWEQDEITFACQLADKLGLAVTTRTRLQAQARLAESERRYRVMIEQSISGFYLIQDDRFVYVNARFAEIFGYASTDEIVGMSPADLTAARDRALVSENIRRRLAGETKSISYSFAGLRKDGSDVDVGVHGSYAIHEGRPAIIGLLQDISERKRADEEIKRYIAQLEQATRGTIGVITAIGEVRDPYTRGHERRVGEIAAAIAAEMGLAPDRVEGIRIAGHMHDVGKIGVPAEILSKPGRLTKAEYELVKSHAEQGYEILKSVDFPWPVAQVAWQHHERLDGSGYPRGLKGDEILLEARILAVADTLEAMTSHRPYRPGLGVEQAFAEISKGRGTLYDRNAVDACLRLFRDKGCPLPE